MSNAWRHQETPFGQVITYYKVKDPWVDQGKDGKTNMIDVVTASCLKLAKKKKKLLNIQLDYSNMWLILMEALKKKLHKR